MELLKNVEERYLRYDFTAPEIHDLSMNLANKTQEKGNVISEKKSVNAQFKSRIDSIDADISGLSNKVASGYEMRKVECRIEYHKPEQGKKTITNKELKYSVVEKMTSEEWNLFNQDPEGNK